MPSLVTTIVPPATAIEVCAPSIELIILLSSPPYKTGTAHRAFPCIFPSIMRHRLGSAVLDANKLIYPGIDDVAAEPPRFLH